VHNISQFFMFSLCLFVKSKNNITQLIMRYQVAAISSGAISGSAGMATLTGKISASRSHRSPGVLYKTVVKQLERGIVQCCIV
jgi:hypothetical protein